MNRAERRALKFAHFSPLRIHHQDLTRYDKEIGVEAWSLQGEINAAEDEEAWNSISRPYGRLPQDHGICWEQA